MELMERSTTDKRLDELNHKVDQGFERVETDMRALRAESQAEFAALRSEFKAESSALRLEFKEEWSALRKEIKSESTALRAEIKAGFNAMDERFERTHHLLIQFCGGLLGSFIVAAAALIATQI